MGGRVPSPGGSPQERLGVSDADIRRIFRDIPLSRGRRARLAGPQPLFPLFAASRSLAPTLGGGGGGGADGQVAVVGEQPPALLANHKIGETARLD